MSDKEQNRKKWVRRLVYVLVAIVVVLVAATFVVSRLPLPPAP